MPGPVPILPLPVLDTQASAPESPHVVRVLDRIRFEVMENHPDGEMHEFAWFAREYPRAYRHHMECAEFRINTIAKLYAELHRELVARVGADDLLLELAQSDIRVKRIYWDFESFLCEIGIALDLLARFRSINKAGRVRRNTSGLPVTRKLNRRQPQKTGAPETWYR